MMLFSGLCRTSEIFGVSEYVLGKLHYTEDKAFQGLSVTSHKWVPITEVSMLNVTIKTAADGKFYIFIFCWFKQYFISLKSYICIFKYL